MEKPILFRTAMVQALLAGRKTQTRRLVKETGKAAGFKIAVMPDGTRLPFNIDEEEGMLDYIKCPYGNPGDVLWVRESFQIVPPNMVFYKADKENKATEKWKPSIFMPKEASRLKLKVTNIRVERVQDITEEDAIAEGVEYVDNQRVEGEEDLCRIYLDYMDNESILMSAKSSYKSLWSKINGEDSWQSNPWVWVIEFERI